MGGKRLRSLASLLWDEEEDGASLHEAWLDSRSTGTCSCQSLKRALDIQTAKAMQLEEDVKLLRQVIQDLEHKLKKSASPFRT